MCCMAQPALFGLVFPFIENGNHSIRLIERSNLSVWVTGAQTVGIHLHRSRAACPKFLLGYNTLPLNELYRFGSLLAQDVQLPTKPASYSCATGKSKLLPHPFNTAHRGKVFSKLQIGSYSSQICRGYTKVCIELVLLTHCFLTMQTSKILAEEDL